MKLPYGYVLDGEEIVIHEERADVVRSIFEYYLAGASLGKVVEMLQTKSVPSPSGNSKWARVAVDKLLSNAKYIPIVGIETYMDVQFDLKGIGDAMWITTKTGIPGKQTDINLLRLK